MKTQTYLAVLEPCSTGYGVYFPDFPGCAASGPTVEQAAKTGAEALSMHVQAMKADSDPIPFPSESLNPEDAEGGIVIPISVELD